MIKGISPGPGIIVTGGMSSTPYIDMSRPSAGMIRYNNNNLEVYDGGSWVIMSGSFAQVELDGLAQEALQWVRAKMAQEKRMEELAKTHPTVADALLARDRAEDAVKIAVALCNIK